MADVNINGLGGPLAAPAADDLIPVWDTSAGQTLKIRRDVFVGAAITGGGTVALGGYTLTVPATGTAALIGSAQTFAAAQTFSAEINAGSIVPPGVSMISTNIQALSAFTSITNGILLVLDTSGAQYGILAVKGGANGVVELLDPGNAFTAGAPDTVASINIYYSSGYKIQNNRAYTTILRVFGFGV